MYALVIGQVNIVKSFDLVTLGSQLYSGNSKKIVNNNNGQINNNDHSLFINNDLIIIFLW